MRHKIIVIATNLALCLALCVVMLGAYTRLTDAGLGCPDWPGCYGHMVLPRSDKGVQAAQSQYPDMPIESRKAWTEMVHRYVAGTLVLLLFGISISLLRSSPQNKSMRRLSLALLILVVFQALLGMWTVTLKLLPVVVMGHLLGGMLIFACLCRLRVALGLLGQGPTYNAWRPWLRLGFVIVFVQIALGGWVSAQYAGIACVGFPKCNGLWFPTIDWLKAFNPFSAIGANYQGGSLDSIVRISIQWVHRLGAMITLGYLLVLAACILVNNNSGRLNIAALFWVVLVLIQVGLGLLNVIYLLPIHVAVAHNGVAALLLGTVFSALSLTADRRSGKGGAHDTQ